MLNTAEKCKTNNNILFVIEQNNAECFFLSSTVRSIYCILSFWRQVWLRMMVSLLYRVTNMEMSDYQTDR